jgi:hypothetical protein
VMTVLGAADPMPKVLQLRGPVVTIAKADPDPDRDDVDVGWKPNALPARRRKAADESFILYFLQFSKMCVNWYAKVIGSVVSSSTNLNCLCLNKQW